MLKELKLVIKFQEQAELFWALLSTFTQLDLGIHENDPDVENAAARGIFGDWHNGDGLIR